jgi:VanZ family protein
MVKYGRSVTSWLAVALWAGFIALLSAVPGERIPRLPVPRFHALVHFVEYAVLGFLTARGLSVRRRVDADFPVALCLGLIIAFALSDEAHQFLVPHRGPDIGDVLYDTVFALIGVNLYVVIRALSVRARGRNLSDRAERGEGRSRRWRW